MEKDVSQPRLTGVTNKKYAEIVITQAHIEPLLKFKNIFNSGNVTGPFVNHGTKLWYYKNGLRKDILKTYNLLEPYLSIVKKNDFQKMLDESGDCLFYKKKSSKQDIDNIISMWLAGKGYKEIMYYYPQYKYNSLVGLISSERKKRGLSKIKQNTKNIFRISEKIDNISIDNEISDSDSDIEIAWCARLF